MFACGVDRRALRQRQPDFIRLAERRHERGAIRFASGVRVCACPSIRHVRIGAKSGNFSENFFSPGHLRYTPHFRQRYNGDEADLADQLRSKPL